MKPTQPRLILAICLMFYNASCADKKQPNSACLNMGYYFYSINEVANRADVEVSLNFWAKDPFELEARRQHFAITSSKAFLFDNYEKSL